MQSEFFLPGPGLGFGVLTGCTLTGGGVVDITGLVVVGSTEGFGVSPLLTLSVGETDGVAVGVWVFEPGVWVAETDEVGVGVTLSVVPLLF